MPKKQLAFRLVCFLLLIGLVGGFLIVQNKNQSSVEADCFVNQDLKVTEIKIAEKTFDAEIAETSDEKQLGLSGRNCIAEDHAMMFPYELSGDYCFWMKDMNFSIDMVWLDNDKKIINYSSNVSPDTYPNTFCPDKPATYILEFKAGTASDNNWQTGSEFSF